MSDRYVQVECRFIRETENAVLIEVNDEETWIPLSQVESMHKDKVGSIVMSQWIANQKGLV